MPSALLQSEPGGQIDPETPFIALTNDRSPHSTADAVVTGLLEEYRRTGEPLSIDFRKVVHWLPDRARGLHFLHPYPAKLLMHIPHLFAVTNLLSRTGDLIFDPFCGSGTVLLEALLAGRRAAGCDVNPLAILIAKTKSAPLDPRPLTKAATRLFERVTDAPPDSPIPTIVNHAYWYSPPATRALARISFAVEATRDASYRDFFRVCLSACARRASWADPRISVPVRLRRNPYGRTHSLHARTNTLLRPRREANIIRDFHHITLSAIQRMASAYDTFPGADPARVFLADARNEATVLGNDRVAAGSAALVITSPPYAGAQKYIRASSLSLGWLGIGSQEALRRYERSSVGREKYPAQEYRHVPQTGIDEADRLIDAIAPLNRLRAYLAANYLIEMRSALSSMHKALRRGGHAVIVVGDSFVSGRAFPTHEFIKTLATSMGFHPTLELIDHIRGRGLMTKRNKAPTLIAREHVLVLKRD